MATIPDQGYRSGDAVTESGWYEFAGLADNPSADPQVQPEKGRQLSAGDVFPRNSQGRACYWKPSEGASSSRSGTATSTSSRADPSEKQAGGMGSTGSETTPVRGAAKESSPERGASMREEEESDVPPLGD